MTDKGELTPMNLVILMPVYNDWDAASAMIEQIDSALRSGDVHPAVLLVDDGSRGRAPGKLVKNPLRVVRTVEVIRLRRNIGHQRAIATGLTHIFQEVSCDAVLVMDSDGEDRPDDIPRLLQDFKRTGGDRVIFAKRAKRMETPIFKICYFLYQMLHRVLTGVPVQVGNFSVIPWDCLSALVVLPELWNHYAAAVFKLRLPIGMVDAPRGKRLAGQSKMDFVSLVVHGLSGISVFRELVATRVLIAASSISFLLISALTAVAAIRLFTKLAVPGWATYSAGLLLILLVLLGATTSGFLLSVLGNRNMASFLPVRDSSFQIQDIETI